MRTNFKKKKENKSLSFQFCQIVRLLLSEEWWIWSRQHIMTHAWDKMTSLFWRWAPAISRSGSSDRECRESLGSGPWCPESAEDTGWEWLFSQHGWAGSCMSSQGSGGFCFPCFPASLAAPPESGASPVASEWRAGTFHFQVVCWFPEGRVCLFVFVFPFTTLEKALTCSWAQRAPVDKASSLLLQATAYGTSGPSSPAHMYVVCACDPGGRLEDTKCSTAELHPQITSYIDRKCNHYFNSLPSFRKLWESFFGLWVLLF